MTMRGLITSTEAAKVIGCSQRTVQRMISSGELQPRERLDAGRGIFLLARRDVEKIAKVRRAGERRYKAEALREAADDIERIVDNYSHREFASWLRDRADQLGD